MKSSSDKKNRIFSLFLLAASLALFGYASYGYYKSNYAKEYALRALNESSKNIVPPSLPDISGYTMEALEKRIPKPEKGRISITPISKSSIFMKMALPREEVKTAIENLQQTSEPVAIEILSGSYTLEALVDEVSNTKLIKKIDDTTYELSVPIFIDEGASLVIQGEKGKHKKVLLSEETGAFITAFGKFFATYSDIIGWRTSNGSAALFTNKEQFRPFLLFWSNSETYIAHSLLKNLGYSAPKMYGLSYSSDVASRGTSKDIVTKAWLINTTIEDLYYGLYSYEVNDIVILNNEFKNNIIYGIDPHDRSSRLIIANNNSYGAKKRHGIIVSREVNNSWIFNNHSHNNTGSGIMLDRNSTNNVIANNTIDNNQGDGLVFIESPTNISYANKIYKNKRSGIRIRNSWDIKILKDRVYDNSGYAMLAYAMELTKNDSSKETRDEKLDPYGMRVSFDVNKIELNNNFAGNFNLMNIERAGFYDVNVFKAHSGYFEGDSAIKDLQFTLYQSSSYGEKGIELYQLNYTPRYSTYWGKTGAHQ